ncbi:hypothetical protein RND81_04G202900 [Saponaria officinalis]|uniref:Uncharacterized protein n=1 Tax=Saponaria officinalis TaxID=3572 RepID=A0AAW1LJU2_SAPOF
MANPPEPLQSQSNPTLNGPLIRPPQTRTQSPRPVHRTLVTTANLANLLPTGTVLGFQSLIPSFSNNGSCYSTNKYLTAFLIWFFALTCFVSSFTDTYIGPRGNLYYGLATPKGLFLFSEANLEEEEGEEVDLSKYRVRFIDFVHAFVSSLVFLVFALGNSNVIKCYFRDSIDEWRNGMLGYVPIVVGAFSSFLFMLFPTTRRGIGYADLAPQT